MKKNLGWSGSEKSEEKIIFRKFVFKLILLLVALAMLLGSVIFFTVGYFLPVDKNDKSEIVVDVIPGSTAKSIGTMLENKGIVKNGDIFYYYARITGDANKVQAGTYIVNKSLSLPELVKAFGKGTLFAETYKVTIPEGYTIQQIAALLDEKNIIPEEEFLNVVNDESFKQIQMLKGVELPVDARYLLEGLLFPKTYEFTQADTAVTIIQKMLNQTLNEIPQEWLDEIDKQGKSLYDVMIMASIIEKEAVVPEERATIAGVYYNRIKQGMKLQADATVQYALGGHTDIVTYANLKIESPYNTYKYLGLPPTPISNAGVESIKAAIYPETHEYVYYVTKKDGTNGHYFAKTYEEHLKNIEISKNN